MNHRFIALLVAANVTLLVAGCQPGSTLSSNGEPEPTTSRVTIPVFEGITLDGLKTKLGSQFAVRKEGPPTILVKELEGHEMVMIVNHDPKGRVQSIVCHVLGPDGGEDSMDRLCAETTKMLNEALGATAEPKFEGLVQVGVARNRIGCAHTFTNGPLYYSLTPKNSLPENVEWTTYKPNHGYRDILVMPKTGPGSSGPGFPPIEGTSFEQLKQLLQDFQIRAQLEGEQVLLARTLDDHTQYVYCELAPGGPVALVEAFVGSVSEGADAMKLNKELWEKLAQFQYKACNPEEVVTFLNGPQPAYAVDFSRTVGHAKFYLPLGAAGSRDRLMIWAAEPPKKL